LKIDRVQVEKWFSTFGRLMTRLFIINLVHRHLATYNFNLPQIEYHSLWRANVVCTRVLRSRQVPMG
jgi:hypothetical protein